MCECCGGDCKLCNSEMPRIGVKFSRDIYDGRIGKIVKEDTSLKVSINADYFRPKFKAIIEDTIGWCNELYMTDKNCEQKLEDALIQCLKDGNNDTKI